MQRLLHKNSVLNSAGTIFLYLLNACIAVCNELKGLVEKVDTALAEVPYTEVVVGYPDVLQYLIDCKSVFMVLLEQIPN